MAALDNSLEEDSGNEEGKQSSPNMMMGGANIDEDVIMDGGFDDQQQLYQVAAEEIPNELNMQQMNNRNGGSQG